MTSETTEQSVPQQTNDSSGIQSGSNGKKDYAGLKYRSVDSMATQKLAQGLGWFSIALGLAEVAAPGALGSMIGVGNRNKLLPAMGLREIAAGIGILSQDWPTAGVWSRVAGDAVDLALLGAAMMSPDTEKGKVAFATAAVLGVTALDIMCAQKLSQGIKRSELGSGAPTTSGQTSARVSA